MELESKEKYVHIDAIALEQISQVINSQPQTDLFLRIYVQGGCGGINYGMAIDSNKQDGDEEFVVDGLNVVVDRLSLPYVENVSVEYDTKGDKPGFRITHPNPDILSSPGGGCGSGSCGSGGCGADSGGGGCC